MTFEAMANAIRSRFKTQIADANSLPTQYDNDPTEPDKTGLWCRLSINPGDSFQKSIGAPGANYHRTVGVMFAQLFVSVGKGDKALYEMADLIKTAFRCVAASSVHFGEPSIRKIGRTENYWQLNVNCPFYADDIG